MAFVVNVDDLSELYMYFFSVSLLPLLSPTQLYVWMTVWTD
jgi:hypothetical protein